MRKSLIFKLVVGIFVVSIFTYGISAILIFFLKDMVAPDMQERWFALIVLALGTIWTGLLGWLAARLIIRPLIRLTESVDKAADGHLNFELHEYKGQDEIGRLHRSFQTMLENLRRMIADVTGSVNVQEQSIGGLESAIKQATGQIESISSSIENLASGAANQAESAQKLLTTVEEATESAQEISKEAEHAIHISKTMTGNIKESEVQVRSLVDGMNHIASTSEKTLSIVQTLEAQANEITEITKLVGEIADQTHLLALNAAIEATHAGEHGHGFAVVAHQIRKLAGDSSSAVEKITHLVKEMQQSTHTVVSESEGQVKLILNETSNGDQARTVLDEVVSSVNEAATAMQSIVGYINTQTEQMKQTFEMAKQITDSSLDISETNAKISATIQEQTAVMEEIAASSEQVTSEAAGLKEKAIVFKL